LENTFQVFTDIFKRAETRFPAGDKKRLLLSSTPLAYGRAKDDKEHPEYFRFGDLYTVPKAALAQSGASGFP
jgi:hypothetical protein